MPTASRLALALATALLLAGASRAPAKPPGAAHSPGPLASQLVHKWGIYVERVHGIPVETWSERMLPALVQADPDNLRAALARDTYEGAMAELTGRGAVLPDETVISQLAQALPDDETQVFGALSSDLVFTPVTPCRVLDTRMTSQGAVPGNASLNFRAINNADYSAQGGSVTSCGTLGVNASALVLNLTAVTPAIAGFATAYPYASARPLASSINYAGGDIVNNTVIVRIPNPSNVDDVTLYTFAQSHFVADIVGYFAPPEATGLSCLNTSESSQTAVAGGSLNTTAPACPVGYTTVATQCRSNTSDISISSSANGLCRGRNNGSSSNTLYSSRTCCRVPGR